MQRTSSDNSLDKKPAARRTALESGIAQGNNPPVRNVRPRQEETPSWFYAQMQQHETFEYRDGVRTNIALARLRHQAPTVFESMHKANSLQERVAIIDHSPESIKIIKEVSHIMFDNLPRARVQIQGLPYDALNDNELYAFFHDAGALSEDFWQPKKEEDTKPASKNKMMQTSDITTTNSVAYVQSEQRFISVLDLLRRIANDTDGDHVVIVHANSTFGKNDGLKKFKKFIQDNKKLFTKDIFIEFIKKFPQSCFYTKKNPKIYDEGFIEIDLNNIEHKCILYKKIEQIKSAKDKNHKNLDTKPPAI